MEVVHTRCCGLDVHKRRVVGCLRVQEAGASCQKTVRSFATTTASLRELQGWLAKAGCRHVAMESTGVYWKPVFNILEAHCVVTLANAQHIKAVPGRKTDVRDCEWIADLLAHGLVRGSFIPPAPIRDLRELTRHRKTLIRTRASEVNRIHKVLESANIKLGTVATDVLGVSGRAMLHALVAGERDAAVLASLARGLLRKKERELEAALQGSFTDHHAFLLKQILSHMEFLDRAIAECDERIGEQTRPLEAQIEGLCTIPGVGRRAAEVLVSEIGVDMSRFPKSTHLASWARMCPGNQESAGKRKSARTGRGNPWLRTALVESGWAAAHSRRTYLSALFHRVARRRGKKKAVVAVGHSMLIAAYHILRDGVEYQDLGPEHFDRLNTTRLVRYHLRRMEDLGVRVGNDGVASVA